MKIETGQEEVINWYYSENEQLAQVESRVLEDQVVDKILAGATIEDQESTYQDALAAARPAQAFTPRRAWSIAVT